MGPLATIPRGGRGWGKRPARRRDRYHKGPTIQLLAAFAPHTGRAIGLPSPNKTGEAMLAFLQNLVLPSFGTDRKLYLIWDNFSAHKRARNLWTKPPANIQFYWTPTNATAPPTPITTPIPTSPRPCPTISLMTEPRSAPNATRMPISRVRCVTA